VYLTKNIKKIKENFFSYKKNMVTYADQTAYSSIFNKVHWGHNDSTNQCPGDDIISNRNRFIIEYDIAKVSKAPKYILDKIYNSTERYVDHVEIYDARDGNYVIISSPYEPSRHSNGLLKSEIHLQKGWTEIYKIYASDACTFMKRVQKRRRNNF
jgi:hypothetical protein